MAWCHQGTKPLPEPMLNKIDEVTRPKWVKHCEILYILYLHWCGLCKILTWSDHYNSIYDGQTLFDGDFKFVNLTHCGPGMLYEIIKFGLHWTKSWLVARSVPSHFLNQYQGILYVDIMNTSVWNLNDFRPNLQLIFFLNARNLTQASLS